MSTIKRVAYAILHNYGKMSHERLELLTYYCQAQYLSTTNLQLFPNSFQAWKTGPVCLELFNICYLTQDEVSENNIIFSPIELYKTFNCSQLRIIYAVCDALKDYTTQDLATRARSELPWIDARRGINTNDACDTELSHKIIHDYYTKNPVIADGRANTRSRSVENAIRRLRDAHLKKCKQAEKERLEAQAQAHAVNNHCKELVDAENMVMRKIRMLNEFKDMSDNNIKTRARMIARSLGKQLCEYEKNEIKRQNFQHNLETVKQQNTTQTSNTTKNSGNTTTGTNTTTGGKTTRSVSTTTGSSSTNAASKNTATNANVDKTSKKAKTSTNTTTGKKAAASKKSKTGGKTTTSTNTTTGGKSKTGEKAKTSRKDEANGKSEANGKAAKSKDS
ncbi:Panacea domain-containing protein [Gardnerella vaginalis]|uniref:Panacea domain-containing protein n=1 Tax=Gardnerella vaginalis TaxID=2702 RepID=UPI0039EE275E